MTTVQRTLTDLVKADLVKAEKIIKIGNGRYTWNRPWHINWKHFELISVNQKLHNNLTPSTIEYMFDNKAVR